MTGLKGLAQSFLEINAKNDTNLNKLCILNFCVIQETDTSNWESKQSPRLLPYIRKDSFSKTY